MRLIFSLFFTAFLIFFNVFFLNVFGSGIGNDTTQPVIYDNREITITVELLPSNFLESDNKKIKIYAQDNTNQKNIPNVTYFVSISKNNENILREYFFAKDGVLIMDVIPDKDLQVKVIGEKQYAHNAYVMSDKTPIQIKGQIFNSGGTYTFDMELRTIDDPDNWVFSLSDFQAQVAVIKIPEWIKDNAKWWSEDEIDDNTFANGIEYMIKQEIIIVPVTESGDKKEDATIPEWFKDNAKWWSEDKIDDETFANGIEYLIKEGIISV